MSIRLGDGRTPNGSRSATREAAPAEPDRVKAEAQADVEAEAAGGAESEPEVPRTWPQEQTSASYSTWREQALVKADELQTLTDHYRVKHRVPGAATLAGSIEHHLRIARETALASRPPAFLSGGPVQRATGRLDAAELELLRLTPPSAVRSHLPTAVATVRKYLPERDPLRQRVEDLAKAPASAPFDDAERDHVIGALRAASGESRRQQARLRSFRSVLLLSSVILGLAAAAVALLGSTAPSRLPLCFQPAADQVVCPTGTSAVPKEGDVDTVISSAAGSGDVPLVMLLGLVAAALAAATMLRQVRGTSTPYSLPMALALLKLPTGALTAVLGLLLMRGEFVPGLSALDTPGQILAWAIVFGYAQQVFTGMIDRQAQSVLDSVGTAPAAKPKT